jgi:tetratricopeptide (TPR) repeat protein
LRTALLLGLLILLVPITSLASDVSLPRGHWRQIEIADLTVITDMKPKKAIKLAAQLIRLEEWLEIFAVVDPPNSRSRTLYLFHDHEALEPFLPLYEGKPANMAGFTAPDFDAIVMALDVTSYPNPLTVLYHEFVHAFLFERAPQCPLWAQEGIAELHSDFRVDGDYVIVGKRIDPHWEVFKRSGFLSEARFLSLDTSDPEYNEGLRQSTYYAQAWATVHYLLTAKERRTQFKDYFKRIHEGQPEPIALYAAFGEEFPNPTRDLKPYVLQHEFPHFRLKRPAKITANDAVVSDLQPVDQHVAFGNLLLRSRAADDPVAVEHFEAALKIDPEQPLALRGLALVATRRGNPNEAIQVLERAVNLPEVDAAASALLGSLLIDEYAKESSGIVIPVKGEVPEVLRKAREQFERALSVESSNPFALYGLGATLLYVGEYEEAQERLERAAVVAPWRPEPQRAMVALQINKGDVRRAREVYETGLKPLTRRRDRYETQVMLVQAEIQQSRVLASRGEHTAARLLLTESRRLVEGRGLVRVLDNALSNVATSETVDRYNAAISLLENSEYEKAIEIFRGLQSEELDEALRKEIDRLLELLARREGRGNPQG